VSHVTSPPIFVSHSRARRAAGSPHPPNIHHRPPTSVHTYKHLRAACKILAGVSDSTSSTLVHAHCNAWDPSSCFSAGHPPPPPLFFLLRPSSTPPAGTAIPASQQQPPLLLRPSTHIPYGLRGRGECPVSSSLLSQAYIPWGVLAAPVLMPSHIL
jgi:hypothetical protein